MIAMMTTAMGSKSKFTARYIHVYTDRPETNRKNEPGMRDDRWETRMKDEKMRAAATTTDESNGSIFFFSIGFVRIQALHIYTP